MHLALTAVARAVGSTTAVTVRIGATTSLATRTALRASRRLVHEAPRSKELLLTLGEQKRLAAIAARKGLIHGNHADSRYTWKRPSARFRTERLLSRLP